MTRRGAQVGWIALALLPIAFLGVFFVAPFVSVVSLGFAETTSSSVLGIVTDPRTLRVAANTLGLAAAGTALSLALGVPAAWALYRVRWRGQAAFRAAVTVPFVLPTVVVAAAFGALLAEQGLLGGLRIERSVIAIVLALTFFNVSVVCRIVGSSWSTLDPGLADVARTLGASPARAFRTVQLRMLAPAIRSSAATVFLFCSTSFGLVLIMGGAKVRTVETEIYFQVTRFLDIEVASVLALLQVAFVATAFGIAARARHSAVGNARRIDGSRALRRKDVPAIAGILAVLGVLIALPIGALVERSLRTSGGRRGFQHYVALASPQPGSGLPSSVLDAMVTSITAASVATMLAIVLAILIAVVVVHGPRWLRWVEAIAMAPLGISAVVVGLGMLLALQVRIGGQDVRTSSAAVAIAQAIVALPLIVRITIPAARSISGSLRVAAATLGSSPWRTWWTIDAPLLRTSTGLAVGFAFAIAVGEFGASTFVVRPDEPTLPTAIARLLSRPGPDNAGMGFAAAVLLATVAGTAMALTERWRNRVEGTA
jgi:thiamine transport system permease protein